MTEELKPLPFRITIEWEDEVDDDVRDSITENLVQMIRMMSNKYQKIMKLVKKISIIKD